MLLCKQCFPDCASGGGMEVCNSAPLTLKPLTGNGNDIDYLMDMAPVKKSDS